MTAAKKNQEAKVGQRQQPEDDRIRHVPIAPLLHRVEQNRP